MAKFLLTTPDGAKYKIEAPDEQSAMEALQKLQAPQAPQEAVQPPSAPEAPPYQNPGRAFPAPPAAPARAYPPAGSGMDFNPPLPVEGNGRVFPPSGSGMDFNPPPPSAFDPLSVIPELPPAALGQPSTPSARLPEPSASYAVQPRMMPPEQWKRPGQMGGPDRYSPAAAGVERQEAVRQLQPLDNAVRSIARGVPYVGGAMDEIAAKADQLTGRGGTYDQNLEYQRTRDAQYDAAHPYLSTAGKVAGAVAGTIAGGNALSMAGVPLPAAPSTLVGKVLAGAGIGAGQGAWEGFIRGEGFKDRIANAISSSEWGAAFGAGFPVISALVGKAFSKWIVQDKPIPDKELLFKEGSKLYELSRRMDFRLNKDATNFILNSLDDTATKAGYLEDAPAVANVRAIFKRLETYRDGSISPTELDSIMKQVRDYAHDAAKSGRGLEAKVLYGMFDDIVGSFEMLDPQGSIMAGSKADPREFMAIWLKAKDTWAKGMQLERVQNLRDTAELGAQTRTYGENLFTALRNQARNPNKLNSWPKYLREDIRNLAEGELTDKALRETGVALNSVKGQGAALGLGGIPGWIIGQISSTGAKRLADYILSQKLSQLEQKILTQGMVRPGQQIAEPAGELAQKLLAPVWNTQFASPANRNAVKRRALMPLAPTGTGR